MTEQSNLHLGKKSWKISWNKNDTIEYWNRYYKKVSHIKPSKFALDVAKELKSTDILLDIGCGDGRDSKYFISKGVYTIGVDISCSAIKKLRSLSNALFLCYDLDDLCTNELLLNLLSNSVDAVYIRFLLHAVNKTLQNKLLHLAYILLKPGGKLFIETRTHLDELNGKGTQTKDGGFITTHYRRFINPAKLSKFVSSLGFTIYYCNISRKYATYKKECPPVLRIKARK